MHKDAGEAGEVKSAEGEFLLRVDGGATVNNLLMQIQVKKITSSLYSYTSTYSYLLGIEFVINYYRAFSTCYFCFIFLKTRNLPACIN